MCKPKEKLDKFIYRFRKGDVGYRTHRLRKFNRRHKDAMQAAATVIREHDSCDFDSPYGNELIDLVLALKDDLLRHGIIGRSEYANFILQCGKAEHRQQLIDEIMEDFSSILKGDTSPNLITIDDDCHTKNDFCGCHSMRRDEFFNWLKELNQDRGPLDVEIVNGYTILKENAWDTNRSHWVNSRVAVVRDGSNQKKTLFVALIGNDLTDALIKTVWLSTDNRLWNLDFENPKFKEPEPPSVPITADRQPEPPCNIHSMDTARPNRANDLARAIAAWDENKTDRSYSVAVWGIGVDTVFGKTVFVPTSFSADGNIDAVGPVDADGDRHYICHIDLPQKFEYGCVAYSEIPLSAFLLMVLDGRNAMDVTICLNDIHFLVSKEILIDLTQKIGMIQNEKIKNEKETK